MIVASISAQEPLLAEPPKSAVEYYAIANARLDRIESDIHCIDDALLTIDYSLNYQTKFSIANADGNWLKEVNHWEEIKTANVINQVQECVAFIEDKFSVFNICHFLFDKLGRTTEFTDLPVDSYFLFFDHPYYRDVFNKLGYVQTELAESTTRIVTYRINRLYISTSSRRFRHPGFNFPPAVIQLLEKLRDACVSDESGLGKGERIYIDRKNSSGRDLSNRDTMNAVLGKFDFVPVSFENYSLLDQARIIQDADIVLGVHGAGLSNALFHRNGHFKLLEILPPLCASCDYWKLASAFGFGYDAYIAHDLEFARPEYETWKHDPRLNRRDIHVDEDELTAFIKLYV